jgi:hypothetical protein
LQSTSNRGEVEVLELEDVRSQPLRSRHEARDRNSPLPSFVIVLAFLGLHILIHLADRNMEGHVGDERWGEMNRTEWRGLGLTDPIKNVEVSGCKTSSLRYAYA